MQRIIVGLDISKHAPAVLREAIEQARLHGARLTVIRAVSIPVELPIEALTVSPTGLPAKLVEVTQRAVDMAVAEVPRELLERAEARLGTPWQVLCDTAKELRADLVVIGTHSHNAFDRLLGTTAARVVNHAPCSVLVVRAPATP